MNHICIAELEIMLAVKHPDEYIEVRTGAGAHYHGSILGALRRRGYPVHQVGKKCWHVYNNQYQLPFGGE